MPSGANRRSSTLVTIPSIRTSASLCRASLPMIVRSAETSASQPAQTPGVYGMVDWNGRLVYVGKSKCFAQSRSDYFLPHNEEDKSGRIVQSAAAIVWETQPTEFAALLREQQLIRRLQPRFNTQGIPRRQRPIHICLGVDQPNNCIRRAIRIPKAYAAWDRSKALRKQRMP